MLKYDHNEDTLWIKKHDPKPLSRRRTALSRGVFGNMYLGAPCGSVLHPIDNEELKSHVELAEGYASIGEVEIAENKFHQALLMYDGEIHAKLLFSRCLCGLGAICTEQGRFKEAMELLTRGYNCIPQSSIEEDLIHVSLMRGRTLGHMAQLYHGEGDQHGAIEYFARAIELMEQVVESKELSAQSREDYSAEVLRLHYELGKIYVQQSKWENALSTYTAAYKLCPEYSLHAAHILLESGRCYEQLKLAEKACRCIYEATCIFESLLDPSLNSQVATCYEHLATLSVDQGDVRLDLACLYCEKAVAAARLAITRDIASSSATSVLSKCLVRYADILFRRGHIVFACALASEACITQREAQPAHNAVHAHLFQNTARMWADGRWFLK